MPIRIRILPIAALALVQETKARLPDLLSDLKLAQPAYQPGTQIRQDQ
jgi:hypothetical protein